MLDCWRDLERLLGQEARCQICANFYSDVTSLRAHHIDNWKTNNLEFRCGLDLEPAGIGRGLSLRGHRNRVWALLGAHGIGRGLHLQPNGVIDTLDDHLRNFAGLAFVLRPENA